MRLYTSSPALEGKKKGKKETKNKRKKEKDAWRHLHLRPQWSTCFKIHIIILTVNIHQQNPKMTRWLQGGTPNC
jgi:hypothetical protein